MIIFIPFFDSPLPIFLTVQIEHDGLFICFDGIYLPHGNEHIFISRFRCITRVIDDVAVCITRVNSKGNCAIVWPCGVFLWDDKGLIAQKPSAVGGVRLPFEPIDILGDDWVEGQRPRISNFEQIMCHCRKEGECSIWPYRLLTVDFFDYITIG